MVKDVIFPRVYISVLNWNGADKTIDCLASLRSLDYTNYQIIVVDNASTDDSVTQIRSAFPGIEMIIADENRGYAGGNELALNRVLEVDDGSGLLWVINNDTVVKTNTLTELVDAYKEMGVALYGGIPVQATEDGRYVIAGRVGPLDTGQKLSYRAFFDFIPPGSDFSLLFSKKDIRPVVRLSGSNLLIPLVLVRKYGFIDTRFFLYSEDGDYCLRLRKNGVGFYLVPGALILHSTKHRHESSSRLRSTILYYQTRNRLILIRRHWGWTALLRAFSLHIIYMLGWLLKATHQGNYALMNALAMAKGIRDAILNRLGKTIAPE